MVSFPFAIKFTTCIKLLLFDTFAPTLPSNVWYHPGDGIPNNGKQWSIEGENYITGTYSNSISPRVSKFFFHLIMLIVIERLSHPGKPRN